MDIKIKSTLKAYTKGVIPDISGFITDCPDDSKVYARKYGEWVDASKALEKTKLTTYEDSGLFLKHDIDLDTYTLGVLKKDLTQVKFEQLSSLENDTTYYVADQTANTFVDGGTSFSDGNNEYVTLNEYTETIDGGNSFTTNFDKIMNPLNSEGVYNG